MNRPAVLAAFLIASVPAAAPAQHPDFSGSWTLDEPAASARPSVATVGDASFRRGDMGSGWGTRLTIAQSSTQLSVQYPFFSAYDLQPPIKLVFALDGSESRNSVMIGHGASEQRSRASWRDSTLVITTTWPIPDSSGPVRTPPETRHVLTLESPATLVIETTRTRGTGNSPTLIRTVYRKG